MPAAGMNSRNTETMNSAKRYKFNLGHNSNRIAMFLSTILQSFALYSTLVTTSNQRSQHFADEHCLRQKL